MKYLILATWLLCASTAGATSISLAPVGEGDLTWLGQHIYHAKLSSKTGQYDPNAYHALEITYDWAFSPQELSDSTIDELKYTGFKNAAKLAEWHKTLMGIYPYVKKGDKIRAEATPGKHVAFFYNGKVVGEIKDPIFADQFTGIWLSPKARKQELRNSLIGNR